MGFSKTFATLSVAALAIFSAPAAAQNKPLPWDGRGQDVTVATLENKFMMHIFKQRQSGAGNAADYVTVQPTGRSPAFNGDTGVINVAVDDKAIFGGQTSFRRSELVQNVAGGATTFFRASIMANAELKSKHVWQVYFPESHSWEVFVDATVSPMKIQFRTETKVQWQADFTTKTWFNFGIAVESSGITLYTSTGSGALAKSYSGKANSVPNSYELHFGLLTLSNDGSAPKMATGQDILSFNGVSVDNKVSVGGGGGGAAAGGGAAGGGGGGGAAGGAAASGNSTTGGNTGGDTGGNTGGNGGNNGGNAGGNNGGNSGNNNNNNNGGGNNNNNGGGNNGGNSGNNNNNNNGGNGGGNNNNNNNGGGNNNNNNNGGGNNNNNNSGGRNNGGNNGGRNNGGGNNGGRSNGGGNNGANNNGKREMGDDVSYNFNNLNL